jgi:hypothetical protein
MSKVIERVQDFNKKKSKKITSGKVFNFEIILSPTSKIGNKTYNILSIDDLNKIRLNRD